MAKQKPAAPAAEAPVEAPLAETASEPAQETPAVAPKAAEVAGPITVFYRDHRGRGTSREFSQEVHGENFAAVAEEFKATNASKIFNNPNEGKAAVEEAARMEEAERREAEEARKRGR